MLNQLGLLFSSRKFQSRLIFLTILAGYALLIIPTVGRLGIGWDEATDLVIAQAYQTPQGMLLGLSWDVSQTRMPMFIVALVFKLSGVSSLILARYTTVLVGCLTLWGISVYGREQFTPATGLLAAALLAINPFFLTFARLAFTESDMYVACTLVWLLVALQRLETKPVLGWALLSAILLSFTISSKAVALVVVPVVCVSFIVNQIYPQTFNGQYRANGLPKISARSVWLWASWTFLFVMAGVLVSRQLNAYSYPGNLHLFNYGFVFLGWFITLLWAIRNKNAATHPIALATFIAGFSLLTFLIVPPEHLTNSGIITGLISRVDKEMIFSMGFMLELAALHTCILFLKSTPVLGFGLLAGFVVSLTQWRRRELTTPVLIVSVYFLTLLSLPLGQTFYTIPILPILSLLAAHQLLRLSWRSRKAFLALILLGLVWWGVEMRQSYPDYHLNGYQWTGARPIFGRSSIGGRSIVFVPLDGVQQAVGWLNMHAKSGQVALVYGAPPYIIDVLAPEAVHRLVYGSRDSFDSEPDYVVVHIGSIIGQGEGIDTPPKDIFEYPFDLDTLHRDYEKVFSLKRAFDLEMVSIWKRK